jgi:myo-inositol-1(or 4)-monophosphatase
MEPRTPMLEVIVSAARAAGESLMRDFARPERNRIEEKGPSDFVSSADLRSQDVVSRCLLASYPDHDLVLEEDSGGGARRSSARFIVDPLDGTTNFLRGVPHFAVSIALEVEEAIVAGVVFDPAKNELFCAEIGHGAWLGRTRLAVSNERRLSHTVIATGVPHRGVGGHPEYLAALARVMPAVAGIRRFGSAALDLAYVAAGRFDAFFERGLASWDVAAGSLLVREAGGTVTKSDGAAMTLTDRDVLGTSGEPLHAAIVAMLAPLHGTSSPGRSVG